MHTETTTVAAGNLLFTVDIAGPTGGAPVLLLHGFPETRHMWRHQLEALGAAGRRVIAPDQRGYSRGARPPGMDAYASERLVGDAIGIMDALGHRQFHLVGHDWGGQIAWLIAAAHCDRLLSLAILSRPHPAAFARAMEEDKEQAARSQHHRAFREADAVKRMRDAGLKPLRDALIHQRVPAGDADIYLRTLMEEGAIEGAMNWYRASNIASAAVPAVNVPTLYIWGAKDATVGRRAAQLTAEFVSGRYRFVEVPDVGHFLVDEQPQRISELLIAHVEAN
jgi:pimeloyl-ACP methyl ester carboxylesterase